jgi:hypothetical protein
VTQALTERGYQVAAPGTTPALLIVYNWGEIWRNSTQLPPPTHFRGNDRARLLLMTTTADAERIQEDLVNDRYTPMKVGRMTLTETERDTLQLSHDDLDFVVVSAYDVAALRQNRQQLVWQVRLATRALGHSMSDSLVSLIHYGAPYFGLNEKERQNLHEPVIAASSVPVQAPSPVQLPNSVDPALVQSVVRSEHATWSGEFKD